MDAVVEFARSQNLMRSPCYSLVSAWLKYNQIHNVPSDKQIRKWWFDLGPVGGSKVCYAEIGLEETSTPAAGDVAVVEQDGGEPLCVIIASNGLCVARAFGRLAIWKPKIIRAWRLHWEE